MNDLKNIMTDQRWQEFQALYKGLNRNDHPQVKKPSCCLGTILGIFAFFICLIIAYAMFVILQLALFNLIMLVVMIVWWYKLCRMCVSVIKRCLDSKRKKSFQRYIRRMKDLDWLKALNIEIQENDEGKWIEIHLNEIIEEKDGELAAQEDDDDQ